MSNIWFTSDCHFGHENVIRHDDRPFKSIPEHDQTLISNINKTVDVNDHLYIIGDFSFRAKYHPKYYREQINCKNCYLIFGNHDDRSKSKQAGFVWCKDYYRLDILKQTYILFHYPLLVWDKSHYGSIALTGHTHGIIKYQTHAFQIDVGILNHEYFPISLEEIDDIITFKRSMLKKQLQMTDTEWIDEVKFKKARNL